MIHQSILIINLKSIKMKKIKIAQISFAVLFTVVFLSCNSNKNIDEAAGAGKSDTLKYAYKAIYSSDISVPSHPCAVRHLYCYRRALDLHVLSTPPAFALSQDQTLV